MGILSRAGALAVLIQELWAHRIYAQGWGTHSKGTRPHQILEGKLGQVPLKNTRHNDDLSPCLAYLPFMAYRHVRLWAWHTWERPGITGIWTCEEVSLWLPMAQLALAWPKSVPQPPPELPIVSTQWENVSNPLGSLNTWGVIRPGNTSVFPQTFTPNPSHLRWDVKTPNPGFLSCIRVHTLPCLSTRTPAWLPQEASPPPDDMWGAFAFVVLFLFSIVCDLFSACNTCNNISVLKI